MSTTNPHNAAQRSTTRNNAKHGQTRMNTEASKRLVTPKELAQILGVSERTVLSYRRIGLIPGIQLSQTTIRFDLDEVLEVLKQEPKS